MSRPSSRTTSRVSRPRCSFERGDVRHVSPLSANAPDWFRGHSYVRRLTDVPRPIDTCTPDEIGALLHAHACHYLAMSHVYRHTAEAWERADDTKVAEAAQVWARFTYLAAVMWIEVGRHVGLKRWSTRA
jgi:hypothetical protein